MNKICCHVWDYNILIYTNELQIIYDLYKIRDVGGIPIQFLDKFSCQGDISLYIFNSSEKTRFIQEGTAYYFYLNLRNGIRHDCLRNLIGQFVSVVAMINGEYPLHSSALSIETKGILLLGDSGAGKTILSIYLCNRENGYWLSNDWSAIALKSTKGIDRYVEITKGYDMISVRKQSLEHITPYISYREAGILLNSCLEEKVLFDLQTLGVKKGNLPKRISYIYIIGINNDFPYCVNQLSHNEAYSILKKEMTWVVSGVNSTLYDKNNCVLLDKVIVDVIPSDLDEIIAEIYQNVKVIRIAGDVKSVGQYIRRQI